MLDEALHEKKIAGIADNIAKNKDLKVVLIAGPSSSGKTTFAKRLALQLRINGLKPKTISVDNYFVERKDTPKDENGKELTADMPINKPVITSITVETYGVNYGEPETMKPFDYYNYLMKYYSSSFNQ